MAGLPESMAEDLDNVLQTDDKKKVLEVADDVALILASNLARFMEEDRGASEAVYHLSSVRYYVNRSFDNA